MDSVTNVLMTGAGSPGGPGILKLLDGIEGIRLFTADMNSVSTGRFLSENFFQIKPASDPDFIDNLLDICIEKEILFILPLVTKELLLLSKNKAKFESRGIRIIVSDYESLKIANNKALLYMHLESHGVPIPDYRVVHSVDDFKAAVTSLGYPNRPVVFKPSIGNGSRGVRVLDDSKDKCWQLFNEKPNSLNTTLDYILPILETGDIPELVVCEYLPGDEVTIDAHVSNGVVNEVLIRKRDLITSGISVAGRFFKSTDIEDYIVRVVASLPGLNGPVGFQLKQSVDGDFRIIESNPRIQGTSVAGIGCGVNLPLIALLKEIGQPIPSYDKKFNVGFLRYYEEVYHEY
jgi:carbamoyl-phosphate synthase large subunit